MKLFIDTEWYDMIQDLPQDKQVEIMRAIMSYPNGDSDTNIWRKIILPKLQESERAYNEKSQRFAENRKKRWQKKFEQTSGQISEQICDKKSEQTSVQTSNRCQYVNENVNVNEINNSRKDIKHLSTARDTKVFTPPTLDEVVAYAKQQTNFAGVGGFACSPYVAEQFWSHYQSQGWRKSNDCETPIRDWHAALRLWVLKEGKGVSPPPDDDLPV